MQFFQAKVHEARSALIVMGFLVAVILISTIVTALLYGVSLIPYGPAAIGICAGAYLVVRLLPFSLAVAVEAVGLISLLKYTTSMVGGHASISVLIWLLASWFLGNGLLSWSRNWTIEDQTTGEQPVIPPWKSQIVAAGTILGYACPVAIGCVVVYKLGDLAGLWNLL